jgi:hypothetical protein
MLQTAVSGGGGHAGGVKKALAQSLVIPYIATNYPPPPVYALSSFPLPAPAFPLPDSPFPPNVSGGGLESIDFNLKSSDVVPEFSEFDSESSDFDPESSDFDGESGNTVYFCLRYENSKGEAGPFGPVFSAVVP